MSALDELKSKSKIERTQLEWAILVCDEFGGEATAMDAAAELAAKDEQIAALRERAEKLETAAVNLFQACSDLPLPEMDRMEKEINELADALREAQ